MANQTNIQRQLIVHGAIVLVVALLCGLPSVVEVAMEAGRMWQTAHAALLVLGVWILATAAVLPLLHLKGLEASALTWCLPAAGYSFTTAVILQAVTGTRAISPEGGLLTQAAFAANLVAVLSSFLVAALTLMGALNGVRASREPPSAPVLK